ncbi:MAG TPA: serine hydrolase [Hymenobacter sp.]|nr:serine hydrolase [Hymenobacter sp.]
MKILSLAFGLLLLSSKLNGGRQVQAVLQAPLVPDWERSAEPYNRPLMQALREKIEDKVFKQINSVVVIKKGKLLVEEYYNGTTSTVLHDTRSVSKSFASALTGIALKDGHLESIEQPLSSFYRLQRFRNYNPAKARITLDQLLTMSSGFAGDDNDDKSPGNENNMYAKPNWVAWTLSLPMAPDRQPGEQWRYFTAGVVVLGDILNQKVPGGLEKYAQEKLFQPLGITRCRWSYTPQGVPSTAGGLRLTPLDLARFGQLYKNGGRWQGQQILPAGWVAESFRKYHQTPFGDFYGYLWWNKTYDVAGKRQETFFCSGNGGNKIFVFMDLDLVVVVTASAYNQPYMHKQVDELMEQYVLPAVIRSK